MSLKRFVKSLMKKGDTLVEVTIAIAIFSFVAIMSVAMMNAGVANAERTLEATVARNEINTQVEALRFIHSAYFNERNLPSCSSLSISRDEKCQQYEDLWDLITSNAINTNLDNTLNAVYERAGNALASAGRGSGYEFTYPPTTCADIYYGADTNSSNGFLSLVNAFVVNPRVIRSNINSSNWNHDTAVLPYVSIHRKDTDPQRFFPASYSPRTVYTKWPDPLRPKQTDPDAVPDLSDSASVNYTYPERIEGIWVFAVAGEKIGNIPKYYDFYVQTCWYGSGDKNPTTLDSIVRLSNPKAIK